ncbi:hypothetical protein phiOC_p130 [Ochrobactrum phage vB_OspM_OC]|nr:hypothetical protein phiOC_p130 [Ochrobactrum phage vB_OspM_OC]
MIKHRIVKNGAFFEWGGPKSDWYYFSYWNWLPKEERFWGYRQNWYDGPHKLFGLWFINLSWSTQWTKWKEDNDNG